MPAPILPHTHAYPVGFVKTIKKTFKTCMHRHGEVNQTTGYCKGCDSWMAASVSSTHYVNDRKYYETFDLAMKAALDMLKSKDCWFTMFQNAQVGTILATTVNAGVALKLKHICG